MKNFVKSFCKISLKFSKDSFRINLDFLFEMVYHKIVMKNHKEKQL
jgi:hypothetical protein